jgi:hypothetical protein
MKVINDVDTVKAIINNLESNKRVEYIRYGDGDLIAMYPESVNQVIGHNNKSFISKDIQQKIIESYNIEDECYFVGTVEGYKHIRSTYQNIKTQEITNLNLTQHKKLYSAIAFQEVFLEEPDLFIEFCKLINTKRTLYINNYIEPVLEKFYGKIKHYISIPKFNATIGYKETLKTIKDINPSSFDQIILSAGQLTRVIAKDLWDLFPDKSILDMGSVSDKIIINESSFGQIAKRSHIKNNMDLIQKRMEYFNTHL